MTPGCVKFTADANYGTRVVPSALAVVPGKIARLSTHRSWQTGRVLHGTNLEMKLLTHRACPTLSVRHRRSPQQLRHLTATPTPSSSLAGIRRLVSIHVVQITREVKPSFRVFMGCLGFLFHAGNFAWIFIGLFVFLLLILLRALPATLPNRMKHHPSCI